MCSKIILYSGAAFIPSGSLSNGYSVFSVFPDLPQEDPDIQSYAFVAVDSNVVTLMQGQMMKDVEGC